MFSNPISKKSNISEANKHLQLLYDRLSECEEALQQQTEAFAQKEEDYQEEIATLLSVKESEISTLKDKLEASESIVNQLTEEINEKNSAIKSLQQKASFLDDIVAYKPMLENILLSITKSQQDIPEQNDNLGLDGPNQSLDDELEEHNMVDVQSSVMNQTNPKDNEEAMSSIQHMVNHFGVKSREFSISDEQSSDETLTTGALETDDHKQNAMTRIDSTKH